MEQCLVVEFEDYNFDKLIYLLDIVDDIKIMFITNDLEDIHRKLTTSVQIYSI